jgi:hypothetical protein
VGAWEARWPFEVMLTPLSPESLGLDAHAVDWPAPAVSAWPTANLGLYFPLTVQRSVLVSRLAWCNGTVNAAANIDVGIYDYELNRLVSTGNTLMSGANAVQSVDITDLSLPPGRYYLAMVVDTVTTATFLRGVGGATLSAETIRAHGAAQEASASPLPATATFAAFAQNYVPIFGAVVGKLS